MGAEDGAEGIPSSALASQGRCKVDKRKVEEMHLEIFLLRMPDEEQGYMIPCYAGPRPFGLLARGTLDESSQLDDGPIYRTQLQRGGSHSLYPRPQSFPWPCSQLTENLLEAMRDLCRHEAVNHSRCIFWGEGYTLPNFCTGEPTFSYWGGCPWLIVGPQIVEWSSDDGAFLPFLQIVRPRRSWASSPESQTQRTRTLEEPFPAPTIYTASTRGRRLERVLVPVTIANPHASSGPPCRDLRGTRFQRHALRMGSPRRVLS
jgi:hypothetical protein